MREGTSSSALHFCWGALYQLTNYCYKKVPETTVAKSLPAWLPFDHSFDQLSCKFDDIGSATLPHVTQSAHPCIGCQQLLKGCRNQGYKNMHCLNTLMGNFCIYNSYSLSLESCLCPPASKASRLSVFFKRFVYLDCSRIETRIVHL